jgi:hypothetical protein
VIAGIGYPVSDGDANVGLRLRGSHVSFYDLSRGERDGYQVDRIDRFELYTLDVCAYAEAEAGRWLVMALWAGAHLSAGEGSFDEVMIVPASPTAT